MKQKLFIFLFLSISYFMTYGQIMPSYVPVNGLIGWWPLDGNANDNSGNGYNGINFGALGNTNQWGIANSCLYFDQDYVEVSGIPLNLQNDFTFSYWQKLKTYNHTSVIIDINQNTICNGTPHVWQYFDSIRLGMCGTAANSKSMGSQSDLKNIWINYTFTNQNGITKMYKNGLEIFEMINNWPNTSSIQFTLANGGNSAWIHDQPSDIYLDDVGLWNRVLTESEITGLVSTNVAVSDITSRQDIELYPVPTNDFIYIKDEGGIRIFSYRILDCSGRIISHGIVKSKEKINIENLAQGYYILKIDNTEMPGFKIIKN